MMRADQGSMFIETLIAAAIVAGVLGMSYQVLSDAVSRSRSVESRRMALLVAQSQLAAIGETRPVPLGATSGVAPPFIWRATVERLPGGMATSQAGDLARVTVTVRPSEGGADLVSLTTLRLTQGAGR
jgi:hypothetical protein